MTFSDTAYRAPKALRMWLEQIEKHPPEPQPAQPPLPHIDIEEG